MMYYSGNGEHEQSLIRCIILAIAALYLWIVPHADSLSFVPPHITALFYLVLSAASFTHISIAGQGQQWRKITFTVLDQVMIAYTLSFGGYAILIAAVSFWVTIGSGFRFGYSYLYMSGSVAALGWIYNICLNPTWSDSIIHAWCYLTSILVVVFYTSVFLRRNAEITHELNETLTRMSNLARVDNLTNLPNRLALVERLNYNIAMTSRRGSYVSVIYFDLDGFKAVNDTLGHNQGDALLKDVSLQIKNKIRSSDMIARLGGDEFVVVVEYTNYPQDVNMIASTILDTICGIKVEGINKTTQLPVTLRVGASVGIATYSPELHHNKPTVEEFIRYADGAMYVAKKTGKGRFCHWSD